MLKRPKLFIRDIIWLMVVIALLLDRATLLRRLDRTSNEVQRYQSLVELREEQFRLHVLLSQRVVDGFAGRLTSESTKNDTQIRLTQNRLFELYEAMDPRDGLVPKTLEGLEVEGITTNSEIFHVPSLPSRPGRLVRQVRSGG